MVRKFFAVFIPVLLLVASFLYLYKKESINEKTITVYTYSSFVSDWGPGPKLKELFFQKTGIKVNFIDAGEAAIIIQRVLLEKNKSPADVVVGLDQFQLDRFESHELFDPIPKMTLFLDEAVPSEKVLFANFVAYNWSPMTFVYRKSDQGFLPKTLMDLTSDKFKNKIVLLNPVTSSPGYIFFHWIVQRIGEKTVVDFFEKIKKNIYNVVPSWSAGYGMFKQKQAGLVFSYLTSPVYHWVEEKNQDYEPIYLDEDMPYHIEYAGILKSSANKINAEQFLKFLLDPEAQKILMTNNFMLPVIAGVKKDTEFEKLKNVKLFKPLNSIPREDVLNIWKQIQW